MMTVYARTSIRAALAVLTCGTAAVAQHNVDLWIGISGGRLMWHPGGLEPESVYHPLDPVDTFLRGWSDNDPGFDHAVSSAGGVAPLPAGSQIWLELVSRDPALFAIDNSFNVLEFSGDRAFLGNEDLHTHITWLIDRDDPRFDPDQCVWEGTFRLVDTGSGLAASPSFTLLFSNVPVRGGGFPPGPVAASGDFDANQVVDLADHEAFAVCLTGPDVRPEPDDETVTTCEVDCHNAFDFDDDLDVDLRDFAAFQSLPDS